MKPTPKHIAKVKEAAKHYLAARDKYVKVRDAQTEITGTSQNVYMLLSEYTKAEETLTVLVSSQDWLSEYLVIKVGRRAILINRVDIPNHTYIGGVFPAI